MADGAQRSLAELGRTADRNERRLDDLARELHEKYVLREVFETRVGALERDKASRRNALLAVAGSVVGVVLSVVLTYLLTRGGH